MSGSMLFRGLLAALLMLGVAGSARAANALALFHPTAATPAATASAVAAQAPVTPDQARAALAVLQDAHKRAQLIDVLRTIATVAAPSAKSAATPAKPAASKTVHLNAGGLGETLLLATSHWLKNTALAIAGTARTVTDFPGLWRWASSQLADPETRVQLLGASWKLVLVLAVALGAEWLTARGFARTLARLYQRVPPDPSGQADDAAETEEPAAAPVASPTRHRHLAGVWRRVQRLPLALLVLIIDLLPVAVFGLVGNIVLGALLDAEDTTRLAIIALIYAYVLCRTVMCATRMLVAPATSGLRLLPCDDQTAAYIEVWVRRITVVAVFGVALADIAQLLGLYGAPHDALLKLVLLIVHLFLVIIILQCRQAIAQWLRDEERHGPFALMRNRLGDIWHYLAIFFVMGFWVVWAFGLKNGYSRLLHFAGVTLLVLVVARLITIALLGMLDRGFHIKPELSTRFPGLEARANRYYPLLRGAVSLVLAVITLVALLEVWGLDALVWFEDGAIGSRLISALITIAVALVVGVAVWEGSNAALDRHMARLNDQNDFAHMQRLRTLSPMLRTALLIGILAVVGLTILSEIGVNTAPLLASAGILGIALGFGSQKLVQDLITGLFLLLENAMQVGDWVTAAGLSGTVEHLSIRTIRLRASDGSVHIIPFSSVTTVTNTNRGLGNAAVSVNIAYDEDTDRVAEAMKEIALAMREDDAFKTAMLSDLQFWGVDKVEGSVVTLVGQIVCTDSGRWAVQREYNRRLKMKFQELGIELANATQTVILHTPDQPPAEVPPPQPPAAMKPEEQPPAQPR